ncbi:hypothetical protein BD410DRAFT_895425 [Rickenella mellea]|uniref:PHD-type domain-containing protein n=1 Tax=Rickenella mellea TaxID=50990 RepID=A0A4Y7QF23_9AGAM|nr:hypothetical protein BD410DRAFT_895425 [Rickenella mellea]
MAQPASMAPPLSPREPRRSNRRSAPSTSTSTSKSSGSPSPESTIPPPLKDSDLSSAASRSGASSGAPSARSKRAKDDNDEPLAEEHRHKRKPSLSSINVPNTNPPNKRNNKRKSKEKNNTRVDPHVDVATGELLEGAVDQPERRKEVNEDGSITRCVCGGNIDEDIDADFMIQCEKCYVWQHGVCMGFQSEEEIPKGDYYCEECRPEEHVELLKMLQKRQRQGSAQSHHTAQRATSRSSRSHSPSHLQKASKRRNTMNSRDAAYEESLREIMGTSAAEVAGFDGDVKDPNIIPNFNEEFIDEPVDVGPGGRRKRKRVDDDAHVNKRKRSASSAFEHTAVASSGAMVPELSPAGGSINTSLLPPPPPAKSSGNRVRRGNSRKTAPESVTGDGDEGSGSNSRKHPNQYTYRGKVIRDGMSRRPPPSFGSQNSGGLTHEHGTRRNANTGGQGVNAVATGSTSISSTGIGPNASSRTAYFQSNAPQQPLFTSWGLPDYLAHLQSILPTEVPAPLVIRGPAIAVEDDNVLTERGVKVKWPAKRMSVADMNKRVRAMVEWVGREQAGTSERERRRASIDKSLQSHHTILQHGIGGSSLEDMKSQLLQEEADPSTRMLLDDHPAVESPLQEKEAFASVSPTDGPPSKGSRSTSGDEAQSLALASRRSTVKMMEELMEELISFQERFGPGAKGRSKDRAGRTIAVS